MQSLIQSLESVVAAMACAAFAHFGVALKAPCPLSAHAVRHIAVATAPAAPRPVLARAATDQRRI